MDFTILSIVITIIGLYGSTMVVLISHERRLTRIEGKIDVLLNYVRQNNNK